MHSHFGSPCAEITYLGDANDALFKAKARVTLAKASRAFVAQVARTDSPEKQEAASGATTPRMETSAPMRSRTETARHLGWRVATQGAVRGTAGFGLRSHK